MTMIFAFDISSRLFAKLLRRGTLMDHLAFHGDCALPGMRTVIPREPRSESKGRYTRHGL